jgi:hypothetical protein
MYTTFNTDTEHLVILLEDECVAAGDLLREGVRGPSAMIKRYNLSAVVPKVGAGRTAARTIRTSMSLVSSLAGDEFDPLPGPRLAYRASSGNVAGSPVCAEFCMIGR